jgi:hypothetical protein
VACPPRRPPLPPANEDDADPTLALVARSPRAAKFLPDLLRLRALGRLADDAARQQESGTFNAAAWRLAYASLLDPEDPEDAAELADLDLMLREWDPPEPEPGPAA